MIDAEVIQLRNLRLAALRARALAEVLERARPRRDSVLSRSAVVCWNIARVSSGRLRAHPYLSYQQGPGEIRQFVDRALAEATGFVALRQGKQLSVFADQLKLLAHELDDVRALTRSQELSDALGRAQTQLRRLVQEAVAGARAEGGAIEPAMIEAGVSENTSSSWPYLAI
jgi:hypothetical protein